MRAKLNRISDVGRFFGINLAQNAAYLAFDSHIVKDDSCHKNGKLKCSVLNFVSLFYYSIRHRVYGRKK